MLRIPEVQVFLLRIKFRGDPEMLEILEKVLFENSPEMFQVLWTFRNSLMEIRSEPWDRPGRRLRAERRRVLSRERRQKRKEGYQHPYD